VTDETSDVREVEAQNEVPLEPNRVQLRQDVAIWFPGNNQCRLGLHSDLSPLYTCPLFIRSPIYPSLKWYLFRTEIERVIAAA